MERFSGVFRPFTLMENRQTGSVLPLGMAVTGTGGKKRKKVGWKRR